MKRMTLATLALAASTPFAATFYYNQVGYDAGKPISIIVKSDAQLDGAEFKLMSGGNAVQTGTLSAGSNPDNWTSNGKFYVATLSRGVSSGTYTLQVTENGQPSSSDPFNVGENLLATSTLGAVLDYFYNDRATNATIVGWDKKVSIYGGGTTRDVHGGWYDASGDVSKYLSHLSYANYLNPQQIPLTVWSLAFATERIPALLASTSTKATTTDEAAFGADFLVRMLDEQGFFYMTVFDNWGMGNRYLCAFTGADGIKSADYQTAFREGGGMAIAALARISKLGVTGDYTSEEYLAAAEKGFAHLSEKQSIGGTCAYCDDGKENIIDDYTALLAATELYAATEKAEYMTAARARATNLIGRLSEDGYFWSDDAKTRPFWHASDAGLPLIALIRYAEIENKIESTSSKELVEGALAAISKHYNWLLDITNKVDNPFGYARQTYKTGGSIKDGFFIPHDNESGYWWQGEDARLASLAAASVYAFHTLGIVGFEAVDKYATDQLDWILGKNPYSTCMMYGFGKKNPDVYNGQSNYDATLKGGIANGITGKSEDGSGIAWTDDGVSAVGFDPEKESWQVWRWDEQWLPHSTWYLMALVARYDEKSENLTSFNAGHKTIAAVKSLDIQRQGHSLIINAAGARNGTSVTMIDINGSTVASGKFNAGNADLDLANLESGIYMIRVQGFSAKKILLK